MKYEVLFPHCRTIDGQLMMFEPLFSGAVELPDDDETRMAVKKEWLKVVNEVGWIKASTRHPKPHARYLIRRGECVHTATPCYGMHEPWWVVKTLDGEAPPEPILPDDEWMPLPEPLAVPGADGGTELTS